MLVLTRKMGEGIAIGDDIKVVVIQVKGKQVRLGIKAAGDTAVHREEVYEKIKRENQLAAQPEVAVVTNGARCQELASLQSAAGSALRRRRSA